MRTNGLELSIIIPHFDDPKGLAKCLESLEAQDYDKSRVEVIVCDNKSAELPEILDKYDLNVILVVEEQRGAASTRNKGALIANGQYLAFTDCDCIAESGFIKNGLAQMKKNGENSVMAGEIVIFPANNRPNLVEAFEITYSMDQEGYAKKGDAATGNMWTSRKLFHEVGVFRLGVAEDSDWCERAHAKGAKFHFGGESIVRHPARDTLKELRLKWRRQSAMTFNAWDKNVKYYLTWPFFCCLVAASSLPHSLKAIQDNRLEFTIDKIKAILILFWCRSFRAKVMMGFYLRNNNYVEPNQYWTN